LENGTFVRIAEQFHPRKTQRKGRSYKPFAVYANAVVAKDTHYLWRYPHIFVYPFCPRSVLWGCSSYVIPDLYKYNSDSGRSVFGNCPLPPNRHHAGQGLQNWLCLAGNRGEGGVSLFNVAND